MGIKNKTPKFSKNENKQKEIKPQIQEEKDLDEKTYNKTLYSEAKKALITGDPKKISERFDFLAKNVRGTENKSLFDTTNNILKTTANLNNKDQTSTNSLFDTIEELIMSLLSKDDNKSSFMDKIEDKFTGVVFDNIREKTGGKFDFIIDKVEPYFLNDKTLNKSNSSIKEDINPSNENNDKKESMFSKVIDTVGDALKNIMKAGDLASMTTGIGGITNMIIGFGKEMMVNDNESKAPKNSQTLDLDAPK